MRKKQNDSKDTSLSSTFPIIGIGASAGGLAAFEAFFSGMPADSKPDMAFVLVQHLAPDHKSMLTELIQRYTRMQVFEVEDGIEIKQNCAYIIPPGYDMAALKGSLSLHKPSAPRGHRLPVDFFFRSLAEDQGERAIAVVLSGTGSDGTLGIRAIKGGGGMIMAQSPESTEFNDMPRNAISTGLVDYVLPPSEMAEALVLYSDHAFGKKRTGKKKVEQGNEKSLETIFELLRNHSGHDFSYYKTNTVKRRIERRMALLQINSIEKYVERLSHTKNELTSLFQDLLIGVTNFFRDSEAFGKLEEQIIPKLFAEKKPGDSIRIWSAGCSTGEEAYSIAILLQEYMDNLKESYTIQLFATDIDGHAITTARNGIYPASITVDISPDRLARYFSEETLTKEGVPDTYRINKKIRDIIIFSEQNIIKDPPFSNIDFISCRNLMIYLNGELHKKLIPLFHYAIRPGGFLFLGSSESIGECTDLFHPLHRKSKLYQRRDTVLTSHYKSYGSYLPPIFHSRSPSLKRNSSQAKAKKAPLRELVEKTILQKIAPASALVNDQGDIFYLHGRTGMFLEPSTGEVGHYNILKMAREGLCHELTSALKKVAKEGGTFQRQGLRVKTNDHYSPVNLSICPAAGISGAPQSPPLYLVMMEDASSIFIDQNNSTASSSEEYQLVKTEGESITELKQELRAKEEYLQSINEELQTANEELKSSNEEMLSMNEELQSTNEELETSKEELQSVNEEIATVNTELQSKISDLSRANNDMNNLLAGTDIATIFVDHQLRVLRFTPSTSEVINLIGSDVGRPVAHIVSNLENYDCMIGDIQEVLDTLIPKEVEVRNNKGEWFNLRILPYRTMDNVIEGAVITFVNISRRRHLEEELKIQLSEKETLLREVHHRIKNNIASIEALLMMQIESLKDNEAVTVLQDAVGRVKSMTVLYNKLLMQEGYEKSSTKEYIEGLVNSLKELHFSDVEPEITMQIDDFHLTTNEMFFLGIIINELLTNSMKHAFKGNISSENSISISLIRLHNRASLTVQDNGNGLSKDIPSKEPDGFGLSLIRMLAGQLKGTYTIENLENARGSRSVVEFNIDLQQEQV